MRSLNYVKGIMLFVTIISLSACEKFYEDDYYRNSDEKLCNRVWIEQYITVDNYLCTHTLEFWNNGNGLETFAYQRRNSSGSGWQPVFSTDKPKFKWDWMNNMEGLELWYENGSTLYFDNVWVRDYYLSGKFGDDPVVLTDERVF